jgi:RNA polymerase sigma factor (sigma-70 family)
MSLPSPWTDQAIASAIAGGGPGRDSALHWWFGLEDIHRWVSNYVVQHGGSEADGEDLYHDVFITFDRLLRENKFRQESSLKTFFCGIAKWLWLNQQRKLGRTLSMEEVDSNDLGQFSEDDMYRKERQKVFDQMFETLGDKCKRVLTYYQLSYTMKEIATEMGYASDQVAMNQCSDCRKKLKALIENSHEIKEFLNL